MRILFAVLRVLMAAAIIAALVGQLNLSIGVWHDAGVSDVTVNVVNFFSFFTVDSNVFSVVVLLIGAWYLLARKGVDPTWFIVARSAVVTYMVTTGIVYNLLLRGLPLPQGSTLGWSNEILHVVAPAYLLLDWLFSPGRKPIGTRSIWVIIIFPIIWAVYTLIRGPITPDAIMHKDYWYPYPFLNPNTAPEGYLSVAFYIVLIAAVIALAGLGVVWLSKRRLLTESKAQKV